MAAKPNFESYLIENKIIAADHLKAAMSEAVSRRISLLRALVEKGGIDGEALAQALARFHQVDYHPGPLEPDHTVAGAFPAFTLRRFKVVPLTQKEGRVWLATANPGNFLATDEIRRISRLNVKVVCASEASIDAALAALGNAVAPTPEAEVAGVAPDTAAHIDRLLGRSIQRGASDLHFEPKATTAVIRERIDGVLYEVERMSLDLFTPMLSRLKLLFGMDIVEKRLAQDGRFKHQYPGGSCEIRGSTLPTIHGEKMVLRLLRSDQAEPRLETLGLGPERLAGIKKICDLPDGLVLVAGPTGCGKTTTIYAVLNQLDRKAHNLIMIEDPVEYEMEAASQVQVNSKIGVTFASMLPFILRQDPDVLMVGEIRDEATTQMVMRAAISGHLVFSSIHAPNAVQTVIRLLDMEVQPHMIVASLKACLSQRLLRSLCPSCRRPREATAADKRLLGLSETQKLKVHDPVGCASCHQLGYQGRFAALEILVLTDELRELILRRDYRGLEALARKQGFRTMREHAVEKVVAGETSIPELVAVLG